MHEELLRRLVAGREKHRRPVDTVEPEDVLPQDVVSNRPVAIAQILARTGVSQGTDVVDERVRPDVGHLAFVPRQRNAPRLAGAGDAEVA